MRLSRTINSQEFVNFIFPINDQFNHFYISSKICSNISGLLNLWIWKINYVFFTATGVTEGFIKVLIDRADLFYSQIWFHPFQESPQRNGSKNFSFSWFKIEASVGKKFNLHFYFSYISTMTIENIFEQGSHHGAVRIFLLPFQVQLWTFIDLEIFTYENIFRHGFSRLNVVARTHLAMTTNLFIYSLFVDRYFSV